MKTCTQCVESIFHKMIRIEKETSIVLRQANLGFLFQLDRKKHHENENRFEMQIYNDTERTKMRIQKKEMN